MQHVWTFKKNLWNKLYLWRKNEEHKEYDELRMKNIKKKYGCCVGCIKKTELWLFHYFFNLLYIPFDIIVLKFLVLFIIKCLHILSSTKKILTPIAETKPVSTTIRVLTKAVCENIFSTIKNRVLRIIKQW